MVGRTTLLIQIHLQQINNAATDDLQPTDGWKSIQSAFKSPSEVPNFSTSNIITYFVTRTAADGLAVGDFTSASKSAENLFLCGHVKDIELSTEPDILRVSQVSSRNEKGQIIQGNRIAKLSQQ